ncbi:MAG: TMEM165/GDT1 family protein [Burkholderiales bacterium]
MEALFTSILLVAVAEIGDKTQLLSFALTARLREPRAIILGILVATLANHALAATAGVWLAALVSPTALRYGAAGLFFAFGLWALRPDKLEQVPAAHAAGVFATALAAFFIAEMGDKTQLATVALAARFQSLATVVAGTTLGMMIANVPAVLVGEKLAERIPLGFVRWLAAGLFILTGLASLLDLGALR